MPSTDDNWFPAGSGLGVSKADELPVFYLKDNSALDRIPGVVAKLHSARNSFISPYLSQCIPHCLPVEHSRTDESLPQQAEGVVGQRGHVIRGLSVCRSISPDEFSRFRVRRFGRIVSAEIVSLAIPAAELEEVVTAPCIAAEERGLYPETMGLLDLRNCCATTFPPDYQQVSGTETVAVFHYSLTLAMTLALPRQLFKAPSSKPDIM
jgi:hypothetical protein